MNYGLYLSASGVLTNMYRQDVFANNLANVHTVAFKPDLPMIHHRHPESVEAGFERPHKLLDRLGGGVFAGPQRVDLSVGRLLATGGKLDGALKDANAFFVVSVHDPNSGQAERQLTRDGRFTLNDAGFLVTASGGHRVLDQDGSPIQIDRSADVRLGPTANVLADDRPIAQLQVASVADPAKLVKQGNNRFRLDGPAQALQPLTGPKLEPGFLEASGVDPIKALMDVINTTKAVTSNANLIRYHDLLMDRAVNVLGRVQA